MKFVSKLFTALALTNLTVAVYADDAAAAQVVTPEAPKASTVVTSVPAAPVATPVVEIPAAPAPTGEVSVPAAPAALDVKAEVKAPEAATKSLYAKTTDALKAAKDGVMTAKDTVVTKTFEAAAYANENRVQVSIATAAVALTVGAIYYVAYQAGKNAEAKRRAKADKQQAAVCCNN